MSEAPVVQERPDGPAATVAELIRSRRTIHEFREAPAPAGLVRKAIDLARWAPNHHLTEPWRFYLLGPETAAAIARLNAEIVTAIRAPRQEPRSTTAGAGSRAGSW